MSNIADLENKTILISRTDSIGDVVLTLPMCVWIKEHYPSNKIIFLGNSYTHPVLDCMPQIDEILEWSELQKMPAAGRVDLLRSKKIDVCIHVFPNKEFASIAKKARIPYRVGTSHRSFHLLTCNIRPNFTRKNSDLHESQLNFELLRPFGLTEIPSLEEISGWMKAFRAPMTELPDFLQQAVANGKRKILLHPKSQGSAVEWGIKNYVTVADGLLAAGYTVIFTGTEKEGAAFREYLPAHPDCIDSTGRLTLPQLISLISQSDALVACSTGPLHLAGILGLRTIGLFSPRKPIHPGRWKALGKDVHILVEDENCPVCQKKKPCNCIERIDPQRVLNLLFA